MIDTHRSRNVIQVARWKWKEVGGAGRSDDQERNQCAENEGGEIIRFTGAD